MKLWWVVFVESNGDVYYSNTFIGTLDQAWAFASANCPYRCIANVWEYNAILDR